MTDPTDDTPAGTAPVYGAATAPPATAHSGAIRAMGLQRQEGRRIPRRQVFAWALWDWATQPFNSVILTFVFTALYLTSDTFLDPAVAALASSESALGWPSTGASTAMRTPAMVIAQPSALSELASAATAGSRKVSLVR